METPNPNAEREIIAAAAALPMEERAAYLDANCAGRATLRASVEAWLDAHEPSDFMQAAEEDLRMHPEEPGERIGNYKLLEEIGEGGFGTVWVADQERPVRRRVALKIIKLGMDTKEVIARFGQERQALAMMDHPHIAKVLDAGATEWGRPYFVMELVRGIKITDYCDQANLPTADRLALFIQVCQAIQHAHQKGIIHRDLKPSNILVTLHDGVPVPKVIDFGVAKATQQQPLSDLTIYTKFEQMIGTPLYMSPEQAERSGLDIDTRSDIDSLGVLLYELLTGRTPFDPVELMRKGYDEIRRAIREQEPQTPSTFLQTMADATRATVAQHRQSDPAKLTNLVRGDLDWIVMKALEKDRTRRYETANGLAMDIQRHLANEPVGARPPSNAYRFQKLVRRNQLAIAAGTAIVAALVIGFTTATWMYFRESHARKHATHAEKLATQQLADATTELLALRRKVLGKDHPQTLSLMDEFARYYRADGRLDEALKLREELLALQRELFGPDSLNAIGAMDDLANSYLDAGRVPEALTLLADASTRKLDDTVLATKAATLQLWFAKEADYEATCKRTLQWAADSASRQAAQHVAKFSSLRPMSDASMQQTALALGRRAAELGDGKKNPSAWAWHQMTLGMAEYRSGHYPAADEALATALETNPINKYRPAVVEAITSLYRAMSLFQQGRQDEARALFAATAAKMKPLPANEMNPLADGQSDHDDLIVWLAFKEARALLNAPPGK